MLLIVGGFLLALGLLSGAVLVLAPLGLLAAEPALTLWVAFPVLSILGFALCAVQARPEQVRTVSLVSSAVLLLMSLASVAALVLGAAALIPAPATTAPLWFVLVVGMALGSVGAASFGRSTQA